MELTHEFQEGYKALHDGVKVCPYLPLTLANGAWNRGYAEAFNVIRQKDAERFAQQFAQQLMDDDETMQCRFFGKSPKEKTGDGTS